jgi:hypothetical protein
VCTPAQLNETTTEVLRERVAAVVRDPADDAGSQLPPIACFITFELLRRLHNIINEYTIEQRGGWAKQPALAKLVVNVTGARRPRSFTG